MDFFSMKRKKLQSLCKKHGIPANIKSKEMAEQLSLIYEGKENTDAGREKDATFRIVRDEKLKVDITDLDLDSDSNDVRMEASDTVAGKDTDAIPSQMDASPSDLTHQFQQTDPLSGVKYSYLDVHEMVVPGVKDNATVEDILDEVCSSSLRELDGTPVQFLQTDPLSNVETSYLDDHKMFLLGIATKDEGTSITPASNSKTIIDDMGLCDVEENMQMRVNKEQGDYSPDVLQAEPSMVLMNIDEENDNKVAEGDVERLNKIIGLLEDVCGAVKHRDETVKQGGINSPQGSNISPGESSSPLVCGEVQKFGDNILVALDADTCEDMLKSSQKTGLEAEQEECIGFSYNSLALDQQVSASEEVTGFSPKLLKNSETLIDNMGLCDVEKNMQTRVNKEPVSHSQNVLQAEPSMVLMDIDEELVHVAPEEFGNSVAEGEVERLNETVKQGGINSPKGSNISPGESSSPLVGGVVQKFGDNILHGGAPIELMCSDLNFHQIDDLDTWEAMFKSSQKTGLVVDQEEWIECSATEGFVADRSFDPSGDVGICNMKESMQSDKMDSENIQEEECTLVEGELTRLFNNSDVHADTGRIGSEDENKPYMMSKKRKRSGVDNTSDPYSDEFVPTMPQPGEMDSCNLNLHPISASETASGDEGTHEEKLESPPKGTPIASSKKSIIFSPKVLESSRNIGTCDMKENIKFDKKEQVGSTISKNKFAKKQPLQDLQKN